MITSRQCLFTGLSLRKIVVCVIFAGIVIPSSLYGEGREEIFIQIGDYKLVTITSEDGQGAISCFYKGKERLGCSESSSELLKKCDDEEMRHKLMREYVKKEISISGGVSEVQKEMDEHMKTFGPDFFNYLDPEIARFYVEEGLRLVPEE